MSLPVNRDASLESVQLAAQDGDREAQLSLGYKYDIGEGVPQSLATAAHWYRKAADQGLAGAQFNLAEMLRDGVGGRQSDDEAFEWYLKAAKQGHAKSQFNVAMMCVKGVGTRKNDQLAFVWFSIAADNGADGAAQARDIVSKGLGVQRAGAENLLRQIQSEMQGVPVALQPEPSSSENKNQKWVFAEAIYHGRPLLIRANSGVENMIGTEGFALKIGFAIPLRKPKENGLPSPSENEQLNAIEDIILREFALRSSGQHVLTLTTGLMREIVFYGPKETDFKAVQESVQRQISTHSVQVNALLEPNWESYRQFAPQ